MGKRKTIHSGVHVSHWRLANEPIRNVRWQGIGPPAQRGPLLARNEEMTYTRRHSFAQLPGLECEFMGAKKNG